MTAGPDYDSAYANKLAAQLGQRHASLLATAEDDLALLRGRLALVHTRSLPEPDQEQP